MPSLGTITLTGKSGAKYGFHVYDRTEPFIACGGIYVMARRSADNDYEVIYIGETDDLSKRPLGAHRTDCFDQHRADKLLIRRADNAARRLADETDLIGAYNPVCNLG